MSGSQSGNPGELCDSAASYSGELGRWWSKRAEDSSHSAAYRNVADYVRASLRHSPDLIIDYACGGGHLLTRLNARFSRSRLLGLDASDFLLEQARRRIAVLPKRSAGRITLIHTLLPDFGIAKGAADLLIYAFPNLLPSSGGSGTRRLERYLGTGDIRTAESLARTDDRDRDFSEGESDSAMSYLLMGRVISLNLRSFLSRGGLCIRVEYAKVCRHELTRSDYQRVAFEEGSLDMPVNGFAPQAWFRVLASAFFRSRVMEDVYQQTGDARDREGGYVITILRAL